MHGEGEEEKAVGRERERVMGVTTCLYGSLRMAFERGQVMSGEERCIRGNIIKIH
jgi:hypothetical protein